MKKNITSYRVIYADTDQMGVAYYANIASGWTKHACVDEKGEITRIPPDWEGALKAVVSSKAM